MTELDQFAPDLIGAGIGRIQIDQFGSGEWRAVLAIFNGPQFTKEAATPSEALRLVLVEANREAADKVRRYRQAINDRTGRDMAAAVAAREEADERVAAQQFVDDEFEALLG